MDKYSSLYFDISKTMTFWKPTNLYDSFQFVNKAYNINTRSSLTDLEVPKVGTEIAKTKISYSGAMLFNSLLNF